MARRDPCSGCGIPTTVKGGVCRTCKPQAERQRQPCTGCGTGTTAADGMCRKCRPTYMKQGPISVKHAVWVNAGPGEWVTIRGVQRWVPRPKKGKAA